MMILLALLLVMDLPQVETNVTVAAKQAAHLWCHVCEVEGSFNCTRPAPCMAEVEFCASVAVRMFARYYYVTRQCMKHCPMQEPHHEVERSFVLLKPTPFLYVRCCRGLLCNNDNPTLSDTEGKYFREGGRAGGVRSRGAWLLVLLALSST
ncbi:lymphocyte antigen 6K [Suricata suricatta]|uniref:lymphocyte antigen 6K n=1 Tax=Suricata suricatta TaxID=37032 RepID=UPI0011554DBA|nr:lymphocyte antigen 6K [Suricata suricatta]XP_029779910.1 lymphocyte antigen 6K [Suricata suricatta]XP_029779911.1 lymphocyte antigen 6K [Suricata suricatta]